MQFHVQIANMAWLTIEFLFSSVGIFFKRASFDSKIVNVILKRLVVAERNKQRMRMKNEELEQWAKNKSDE